MLIREVTPTKPTKPQTAAQQRVSALQSQLAQARGAVKRERLAQRQLALNQEKAALTEADLGARKTKPPPCERGL